MLRTLVALALAVVLVSGCAHTIDATHLGVRATLAEPAAAPATGTPFIVTKKATFLLWGLVPLASPQIDDVLAGQLADSPGVADLRVRIRSRWTDVLFTALTAGLVVSRTVTYEGIIVPR